MYLAALGDHRVPAFRSTGMVEGSMCLFGNGLKVLQAFTTAEGSMCHIKRAKCSTHPYAKNSLQVRLICNAIVVFEEAILAEGRSPLRAPNGLIQLQHGRRLVAERETEQMRGSFDEVDLRRR